MNDHALTRKVRDIPNQPYTEKSKGDAISAPCLIVEDELRDLEDTLVHLQASISSNERHTPYQQEDPCSKAD
jgi:hypothetical protein